MTAAAAAAAATRSIKDSKGGSTYTDTSKLGGEESIIGQMSFITTISTEH